MTRRARRARLVSWSYPPSWRARYGEELLCLLEDTHGEHPMSPRAWASLVAAGLTQRGRAAGVVAGLTGADGARDRARAGTLSVWWAWLVFVLAGSAFAKFSEHWDVVTRPAQRAVPSTAMTVMQGAAVVGALVWLAVAVTSWRALVRVARRMGPARMLRLLRPALVAVAVVLSSTGVLVEVAHHLSASQRNGASAWYGAGFLAWATLCSVGVVVASGAVLGRIALRLEYSRRELRILAGLDVAAMAVMGVIVVSMIVWWASIAGAASRFFTTTALGATGTGASVPMVLFALMMAAGLALATSGTRRALRATRALARA